MRSLAIQAAASTLYLALVTTPIGAQQPASTSLSQQLQRESSVRLAKEAREQGDAVRGAILFSQRKFNCIGCHAQGKRDLLGPDLTQKGKGKPDEHFVESILKPSRVIEKEYQTYQFLLNNGRVVVGRVLDENTDAITIRDASRPNERLTLATESIEQRKLQSISAMPQDLVDQLSNRQEFLDLTKYVMDIAATELSGHSAVVNSHPEMSRTNQSFYRGLGRD